MFWGYHRRPCYRMTGGFMPGLGVVCFLPLLMFLPTMLISVIFNLIYELMPIILIIIACSLIAKAAGSSKREKQRYNDELRDEPLHKFYEDDAEELARKYER